MQFKIIIHCTWNCLLIIMHAENRGLVVPAPQIENKLVDRALQGQHNVMVLLNRFNYTIIV